MNISKITGLLKPALNIHKHRKKIKIGLTIIALLLLIWNIVLVVNNLQTKTVILGLKLGNQPLNFLDRPQIEQIIKKELENGPKTLKFKFQGKVFEFKREEIGATVNPTVVANKLISEGRAGNFLQNVSFQTQALLGLKTASLTGDISQSLLTLKILEIQTSVDKPAMPIRPDFKEDLSKTLPTEDGVKVDTDKLTVLIADNIFNPPLEPLELPTIKTFTTHKEEELMPIRKQVPNLIKEPLSIASGGLVFTLTVNDLKNLLTVVERPDQKSPKDLALSLRLDDNKLNQMLGDFAQKVENVTFAEFDDHEARVAIYSQFFSGKRKLVQIPTGRRLGSKVLGITNGPKIVYLTFDDGPNSIYHPMILDILKSYNVKATFFLVGQNTQRDIEVAKRTVAEGHVIGNHTLTHVFLPNLGNNSILKEIQTTEGILTPLKGTSTLFRPPYGGVNLAVKKNAADLGLKLTLWDVDPRDWSEPPTEVLVNRVVSNTFPGADILMHSNHLATVKALPKIIEALKNQGYEFQTLN